MKLKLFIFVFIFMFISGYLGSILFIRKTNIKEIDTIYMNEIIKSLEENYSYLGDKLYDYKIISTSDSNYYQLYNRAIKNRDSILDLSPSRKIIFFTSFDKTIKLYQSNLFLTINIIFFILLIFFILYMLYLQNYFFKPFQTLKRFSKNIAIGNFDFPLPMDKRHVFGAFTESFDLMREELKKAKYNENLANISKRELIASLSHDIKTPIASIKTVSELLLSLIKDNIYQSKIKIIYDKAETIDQLITDMFHSTLEELGELKINQQEQYSSILYELIKNADYDIHVSKFIIPDCMIFIDPLRLGQILVNIFSNSYKYANTPIDIFCTTTNAYLELEILDYGNGVEDDELPVLFGKYFRGSNSSSQSGVGLGLYIAKYLIEKQGGEIICYNHSNGFAVKLLIPLV